jgi:pyruvate/2-oxoglutarate dehydrogenase complex dihydrolipoamide acyltransferase (E2) component
LAADHRILDGVSGLKMLNAVIANLEKPLSLLT